MTDDAITELSTYHLKLTDGDEDPELLLIQTLADVSCSEVSDLPPLYCTINEMVESLFQSPPAPEAKVKISFSYEDYRITLYQDGHAVFQQLSCE